MTSPPLTKCLEHTEERLKERLNTKNMNIKPKRKFTADKSVSRTQKSKQIKASPKQKPKPKKVAAAPAKTIKFSATEAVQKAVTNPMLHHTAGRLMLVMKRNGAEAITESEQDFGFHAFAGLEPKNTAEVLLATQMVACHEVGMALIIRAKQADNVLMMQEAGNLAAKLLGLFERQFAALTKARKPPQVVTVEHVHKHLHVNGQPIPGATGVINQIEGQPYETKPTEPRASAIAPGPEMLGDAPTDPDALPVASDAERALPDSRRLVARGAKR